jgi:DNA polymerase III delta prime subunit
MKISDITGGCKNFIFLGEAGSGKSEIALNFARWLSESNGRSVHFFDMDMTKPLFRSRDARKSVEGENIVFHYQEQFMDAPTLVGGVVHSLKDRTRYVVMDVGGDYIGARSIGGFAPYVDNDDTRVYYVLNVFRPWSCDIAHIDETLGKILGVSHINAVKLHMINNPNNGHTTTKEEFLSGNRQMQDIIYPYAVIDFACVREELYTQVKDELNIPVLPVHLYLSYF